MGDSSCVLIDSKWEARKLNNEHKPNREDEEQRIKQNGFVLYRQYSL